MDLYCGCGGLAEGLKLSGLHIEHGVDNDHHAGAAFETNNPQASMWFSDVSSLLQQIKQGKDPALPQPGSLDVISCGPPCQGFTALGHDCDKSAVDRQELSSALELLLHMRPRLILCENVPGLLRPQHVGYFREFVAGLVANGYQVQCAVLCAAHYGVPTTRKRLFIFAALPGIALPKLPKPTHNLPGNENEKLAGLPVAVTAGEALAGLPVLREEGCEPLQSMWVGNSDSAVSGGGGESRAGAKGHDKEQALVGLPSGFARWCRGDTTRLSNHVPQRVTDAPSSINTPYLDLDQPSGTVLTKPSPRWSCRHPVEGWRYITPREAARLQSFPDALQLRGPISAQYKQVGNAVPVLLAYALGRSIVQAFEDSDNARYT